MASDKDKEVKIEDRPKIMALAEEFIRRCMAERLTTNEIAEVGFTIITGAAGLSQMTVGAVRLWIERSITSTFGSDDLVRCIDGARETFGVGFNPNEMGKEPS